MKPSTALERKRARGRMVDKNCWLRKTSSMTFRSNISIIVLQDRSTMRRFRLKGQAVLASTADVHGSSSTYGLTRAISPS